METRKEREATYRHYAEALNLFVEAREKHAREMPNCGAAPLCIGPDQVLALGVAGMIDHRFYPELAVVAIGELSRLKTEKAALSSSLEVQRGLTNDMVRAHNSAMDRAAHAEEEQQLLLAKVDDLERKLSTALAELTVWEEAADMLGPVHPLIEP